MNGCSFQQIYGKIWVGFCLNTGKRFFLEVLFYSQQKKHDSSKKKGTKDFQNSFPFKRAACFCVAISGNFEQFQYLTLKQTSRKTKTFFKKLEYSFLVESTKIRNASFPYKTAISEATVKTNRMVSTKWTYHKDRSFASNHFIF